MKKFLQGFNHKSLLCLIIALIIVVTLGLVPQWKNELSGDYRGVYYPLAHYFSLHKNLTLFNGVSIYPPGANLFFLAIPAYSVETYHWGLIIANIILLLVISKITKSQLLLALIIITAGPIILFRFDLLVMLLVTLSIVYFRENKVILSGSLLGLATITKFFPVIFLPYFLLVLWLGHRKKIWPWLGSFIFACLIVLGFYTLLTNQHWSDIVAKTNTAFAVSVHVESVIGSILTLITAVTNPGPHGVEFREALWTLSPLYFLGHARIFKLITPIALGIVYTVVFFNFRRLKTIDISMCLLIVLTLIVSSQLFSPQYLIWPAILVVLLDVNRLRSRFWLFNLSLLFIALICTQIIYPLNYNRFIDFFTRGENSYLFIILVVRNLALVILTVRLFIHAFHLPILPSKKT